MIAIIAPRASHLASVLATRQSWQSATLPPTAFLTNRTLDVDYSDRYAVQS